MMMHIAETYVRYVYSPLRQKVHQNKQNCTLTGYPSLVDPTTMGIAPNF